MYMVLANSKRKTQNAKPRRGDAVLWRKWGYTFGGVVVI
jgi:hypothetical protein